MLYSSTREIHTKGNSHSLYILFRLKVKSETMHLHTWHHILPCPSSPVWQTGWGSSHSQLWRGCLHLWFYLFPEHQWRWVWDANETWKVLLRLYVRMEQRGERGWKGQEPLLCVYMTGQHMVALWWSAGMNKHKHLNTEQKDYCTEF